MRAPNLFTVPGDPLAGYLFANGGFIDWTIWLPIAASLALYAGGLLMNDVADLKEDLAERPDRPLPSGAASRRNAIIAIVLLIAVAFALLAVAARLPAILCGAAIIGAISSYNLCTKHIPVVGALNMGLCRSLSVMLGASVGPISQPVLAIIPAVIIGVYIATITNLARHETKVRTPLFARLLPGVALVIGCTLGARYASQSPAATPAIYIFALAAISGIWLAAKLFRKPPAPLPPLIGAHIRLLLLLQAAFCFTANPWLWETGSISAIVLVAMWPVSRVVARRFYAS